MFMFIFLTIKMYIISLTYLSTWVIGVLPSVIFLYIFNKFYKLRKKELIVINGQIESIARIHSRNSEIINFFPSRDVGFLTKITFSTAEERIFFKDGIIRANLWQNIGGSESFARMEGTFICVTKGKKWIEWFAFKNENNKFCFLEDMDRPHSKLRISLNILLRVMLILFLPYVLYTGGEYTHRDIGHLFGFFSTPTLIIFGYSIYNYIFIFLKNQKLLFEKEKYALKANGIPEPLG